MTTGNTFYDALAKLEAERDALRAGGRHDAEVLRRLREKLAQFSVVSKAERGDARAEGYAEGQADAMDTLDRLMVEVPYE